MSDRKFADVNYTSKNDGKKKSELGQTFDDSSGATAKMANDSKLALAAANAPDSELLKQTFEALPGCSNFVRYDDANLYLGLSSHRTVADGKTAATSSTLEVVPLGHPENAFKLNTADLVVDSIRDGNNLYLLTHSGIEEWNLNDKTRTAIHKTYNNLDSIRNMEMPQSFARAGDKLVIAHGRLGVSFFDLNTKTVTNQFELDKEQRPLESMATGVSIDGNKAYVAMSNYTIVDFGTQPFRGIVKIDLDKEKVISKFDGMDPGIDAILNDGKKLIVSFDGNPIWKYVLKDFEGKHLPRAERRIYNFPDRGHPIGKPALDSKYYLTCFSQAPAHPGEHYKNVPKAFDRHTTQLD